MTNTHWIVVANGSQAALFSRAAGDTGFRLKLEAQFAHPDARRKGADLRSDRPGAVRGHGSDSAHYVPHMTPKRNELEHFGRQVADELDRLHRAGRLTRLSLVASNPFLGVLRAHLAADVRDAIDTLIARDYTALQGRELHQRLAQALGVPH